LSKTSYIEPHEEEEAKRFIAESFGFEMPTPVGDNILVKLHIREEDAYEVMDENGNPVIGESGQPIKIELPRGVRYAEKFRSCIALVLAMGELCFKDAGYDSGPPYKVGDWLTIPRNDTGIQFNYRDVQMMILKCDRTLQVIQGPSEILRYNMIR
jgi:hypothetical protein